LLPLGIILTRGKWFSKWDTRRMEKVQAGQANTESK